MSPARKWLAGGAVAVLLSAGGLLSIKQHEGMSLAAYPDPATGGAPWTICYGHTGHEVRPGLRVSQKQCDKWLREDVAEAEAALRKHVRVPLRQGAWDAYVSFIFNVGEPKFAASTMLRKLNSGDYVGSCKEFPKWKYANKKVMKGLVVRRHEELATCLKGGPYVYHPAS
jgi:lysozyme